MTTLVNSWNNPVTRDNRYKPSITDLARKFDEANPLVWQECERLFLQAEKNGRKRISTKLIFEYLRSQQYFYTQGEPWKLNNNYTAYYARKLAEKYPQSTCRVELRKSQINPL